MADDATATSSQPWFVTAAGEGTGQSITAQRTALNEQTTGVANDLSGQNTSTTTALNAILTSLNNKPSA